MSEQEKEQLSELIGQKFEEFREKLEQQQKSGIETEWERQQGQQLQHILQLFESKFEQFEINLEQQQKHQQNFETKFEHKQVTQNQLLFSGVFLFLLSIIFSLVVHIKNSKRHWMFDKSSAECGGPMGQPGIPCV